MSNNFPVAVELKELSILYLDDEPNDLKNFEANVNLFNLQGQSDLFKIRLTTCLENTKALQLIEEGSSEFKVFLCDHNMPQRKGLDFITKLLKPDFPDLLYVLYTGAGNLNDEIVSVCRNNDILFFEKTEEFNTLIAKIYKRISPEQNNVAEFFFRKVARELIADLEFVEKTDPDFVIIIGGKNYKPKEVITAISKRTKLGADYIDDYLEGLKFFNK